MANVKSAEKRNRQNIKRRERGKANRSAAKTAALKASEAIKTDVKSAAAILRDAVSILAKTAHKGSIPKTRASRKISRLYKAMNKAAQA
jgi:small subunit ribosomal protein S20